MRLSHLSATACLVLASFACPEALGAQEAGSGSRYELGEFLVSAEAESPLALAPAGSVVVLDEGDIERSGAKSLAELLMSASGSFVSANGPRGLVANLSIRGSSSAQVLLILDGQRLNDARQGAPDLSQISLDSVEKVEVLSGGASAVYGPDALGGVVVITTKRPEGRRFAISAENAAYPTALGESGAGSLADGQRLNLEGSLSLGQGGLSFGATVERAANAYPYGGPALRDDADLLSGSVRLGLELPLGGGIARATLAGAYQDAGLAQPELRQKDSSLRGTIGWVSDALLNGALSLSFQGQGGFTRLDYEDPSAPDRHDMASGGAHLRAAQIVGKALEIGYGASLSYEAAESTKFAGLAGGQPKRLTLGAYLAPSYTFGRLNLIPTLRYDWSEDFPAGVSAMFGAVYSANEALSIRLSGGRSYRAPTFNELYWPFEEYDFEYEWDGIWYPKDGTIDMTYVGNPDLKAERAWSTELGFTVKRRNFVVMTSVFARFVEDLIVSAMYDGFINYRPENTNNAFVPGISTSLEWALGWLRAAATYDFLHPLDTTGSGSLVKGERIESLSAHKATVSLGALLGRAEASLAGRYWSERTVFGTTAPAALVLDLRGKFELSKGLSLSLAAENLLNAEYEVVAGYPMPGLRIVSGVKLEM